MIKKALFPGSFDPLTNGHIDTIERSAKLADYLFIAVATNTSKKNLFDADEKIELIQLATRHLENVSVIEHTNGLTVDLAKKVGASTLIRGLRNAEDFEYEMNIAAMNKTQNPEIETIILMASQQHRFLSSSLIKEVAFFGGDVSNLVPTDVNIAIKKKYSAFEYEDEKS
ncbi:pantetheine-phosphate adenylyltransferase [Carnobacterium funditum]|uniref:pantetheine-phosphate adenylyltransferase n=1 Tax=Carnobacterium funditum TaxID=2752 RepID=UPI000556993D|nr:pantetheine-phosphate adenylyltransferase [Carnobacterium funditum]